MIDNKKYEKLRIAQLIYHIDAHPRFVGNDKYINYTTTIRGEVDMAMAVTADLIEATKA